MWRHHSCNYCDGAYRGYGPGASFTPIDNAQWQVNYTGAASHDVVTFLNGGATGAHPNDAVFL